jgi:3-oxoacyl-[acyl-carrier-protein] synthase III
MRKSYFGVGIERIVSLVPSRVVSNELLVQESSLPVVQSEKAIEITGIEQRRKWSSVSHDPLALCERACRRAIRDTDPAKIGMLYFNTLVLTNPQFRLIPTPAEDLRVRLELPEAGTISTTGGCAAFLSLLFEAVQFVAYHRRKALVVGIENTDDFARSGVPRLIFGDACGVFLLTPIEDSEKGFLAVRNAVSTARQESLDASVEMNDALVIKYKDNTYGDNNLFMKGRSVSQFAETTVVDSLIKFMKDFSIVPADIDVFIPHQANLTMMRTLKDQVLRDRGIWR